MEMTTELINWLPLQDRHRKGTTSRGDIWIRYDRDGVPVSIYLMLDGEKEKHQVSGWLEVENQNDDSAKELAQLLFENLLKAEEIANRKIV